MRTGSGWIKASAAALIALACSAALPSSSSRTTAQALSLKRSGGDLYLAQRNGDRLLLARQGAFVPQNEGEIGKRFRLPHGIEVTFGSRMANRTGYPNGVIVARRNGRLLRQFSFEALRDLWVKSPQVWPERKGRPHLSSGDPPYGDFQLFATDAMRLGPDVVFTLNWRQLQGSPYPPVTAQFLMRLQADPVPRLTRVARLDLKPRLEEDYLLGRPQRLFPAGDKVFLYLGNHLMELHPGDLRQTSTVEIPRDLSPHGLLEGRWLILFHTDYDNALAVWVMDLKHPQMPNRILDWPANGTSAYSFPPRGNRFLIVPRNKPVIDRVSVPDGALAEIPDPRAAAWKSLSAEITPPAVKDTNSFRFPGGVEVVFGSRRDPKSEASVNAQYPPGLITVRRNGTLVKEYRLAELRDEWLSSDRAWRNHADANGMRYTNGRRPFQLFVSDPWREGKDLEFVLNWRDMVPSVTPVVKQFLMRLSLEPEPRLTAIRQFDVPEDSTGVQFYPLDGKRLLYDRGTFYEMQPGDRLKPYLALPDGLKPAALYEGRWLVLSPSASDRFTIWVMDMKARKGPKHLLSLPIGQWAGLTYRAKSRSLLVNPVVEPMALPVAFVVPLLHGRRREIPKPNSGGWLWFWQGMIVLGTGQTVYCYDAATGRRIAALPL